VAPEKGCLAYFRLPGVALLDVPHEQRLRQAPAIATDLGRLLRALHAVAPERAARLVDRDDVTLGQWLEEAVEHYTAVAPAIPGAHRRTIHAFLAARAPEAGSQLVFTHNDLGAEHVLVDQRTWKVTGILDWADAALADPPVTLA
jgi:aminoglycoside phosphotransferase (APT) family kinase protein